MGERQPQSRVQRRKRARRRQLRRRILAAGTFLVVAVLVLGRGGGIRSLATTEKLKKEGYPESLIELMERNPEAKQFVLDYPKKKDSHPQIDLSGEVTEGEIPLFLQWDERWGYEKYSDDFLAVNGCGPTCLSMVVCGLSGSGEWDPYKVASMADEAGYYVPGSGSSWDLMDSGAASLGLQSETISLDATRIKTTLLSGMPIICSMRPGDFTTKGHFIVLAGVAEDGNIIVRDPNSRKNSEKTWDVDDLIPQIKQLWAFQKQ